jgi:hypothetical protein
MFEADPRPDGMAVPLGHDDVLAQAAGGFPGAANEPELTAGVRPLRKALIALAARYRGINGHAIARADTDYACADRFHRSRALVPDGERILDPLGAYSAGGIVVNIRPADADGPDPHEHIIVTLDPRLGDFPQRHLPYAGELYRLHAR